MKDCDFVDLMTGKLDGQKASKQHAQKPTTTTAHNTTVLSLSLGILPGQDENHRKLDDGDETPRATTETVEIEALDPSLTETAD